MFTAEGGVSVHGVKCVARPRIGWGTTTTQLGEDISQQLAVSLCHVFTRFALSRHASFFSCCPNTRCGGVPCWFHFPLHNTNTLTTSWRVARLLECNILACEHEIHTYVEAIRCVAIAYRTSRFVVHALDV